MASLPTDLRTPELTIGTAFQGEARDRIRLSGFDRLLAGILEGWDLATLAGVQPAERTTWYDGYPKTMNGYMVQALVAGQVRTETPVVGEAILLLYPGEDKTATVGEHTVGPDQFWALNVAAASYRPKVRVLNDTAEAFAPPVALRDAWPEDRQALLSKVAATHSVVEIPLVSSLASEELAPTG